MKEIKKKVGRPATGLKRDKMIPFRVSQDEYELIKKRAEKNNISINRYIFEKVFKF